MAAFEGLLKALGEDENGRLKKIIFIIITIITVASTITILLIFFYEPGSFNKFTFWSVVEVIFGLIVGVMVITLLLIPLNLLLTMIVFGIFMLLKKIQSKLS
ncbi:membrane protein [Candidatus Magnetobacterium bavaricum]|uniref:Membrane protein n=1 Tax=Candidatus Magnetobacterium bavaricum TaxID=29290 RepID=A0A0F3GWX8_9BACT|nr:membrane protein [Candidatus Magnetobacterium bavaricum]